MTFVDWSLIVFLGGVAGLSIIAIACLICRIAGVFANDADGQHCGERKEKAAGVGLNGVRRAWRAVP